MDGFVRKSIESDLGDIYSWLEEAEQTNVPDSFLCNWNVVKDSHQEGKLIVFAEDETNKPIAFQCGALLLPGILEVKFDKRKNGIGRKLVDHCVEQAINNDEWLLRIQCKPSSSIEFWKKMQFRIYDERNHAFRIIPKRNSLPNPAQPTAIEVNVCERKSTATKVVSFSPTAVATRNEVFLAERISFFKHEYATATEPFVQVLLNGKEVFFDKTKRNEAKLLGFRHSHYGFCLDKILGIRNLVSAR